MWQSRMVKLLRASCELSLREPFFAQQHRSMAVTSAMQPHMRQAVMDITQRIGSVDLVIEMRDARIPQTSANYNLINLIRGKPKRLLLLNKADLAHKRFRKETLLELESSNQKVLFTNTASQGFAAEVLAAVRTCLPGAESGLDGTPAKGSPSEAGRVHVVMVVGTPNVGKTSLINALRRHARTQGLLDAEKTGQLPVGPLPGVTKHVSGIKVSDNPTMLLIDTPGVMLPKLTASIFAYRVALAGLVQETQVELSELFAFTLYVLAQSPNQSQLKAVLAEPIPEQDAGTPQGSTQGTQAMIRYAYASKRFAKCILQSIDEVLAAYSSQNTPPDETGDGFSSGADHDVWSQQQTSCDVANDEAAHARKKFLPQGSSRVSKGTAEDVSAQQFSAKKRPRLASEYLAMLHSSNDPSENTSLEAVECATTDAHDTAELPAIPAGSLKKIREPGVPQSGGWMRFDDGLWSACADILLRKLIKPNRPFPGWEPPVEQANAAMEKVVRLVRLGHMGKLVFEEPQKTPPKERRRSRAGSRSRLAVATAQVSTGHVVAVN